MEYLIGLFAMIGSFFAGVFGNILAHDVCQLCPRMCRRLIDRAVRILPESDRARYSEEWLSHLNDCPGVFAQFSHASSCIIGAYRLNRVKPPYQVLRIEYKGIGYVEVNYPTAMLFKSIMLWVGSTHKRLVAKQHNRIRLPFFTQRLALGVLFHFTSTYYKYRKFGAADANKLTQMINLYILATKSGHVEVVKYVDGAPVEEATAPN